MARVERFGGVELWLGDGREILPTLGPELAVVTDPPYGIGYQHSGRSAVGVELDPRHFDTACRRVEAEVKAVEAAVKAA